MTPGAPEILRGGFTALVAPPGPAAGGAFAEATVRTIGLLLFLLAQEVETAAARRHGENQAIRALFRDAVEGAWAPALGPRLAELARGEDQDLRLTALDAANAALRRALIALHEAVADARSAAGRARERRILRLLKEGAHARLLTLPGEPRG